MLTKTTKKSPKNPRWKYSKWSKKPKKKAKPRSYPLIPESTMISMMGKKRWKAIIAYIFKKYGTRKVLLGYHRKGAGAFIYVGNELGRCLGSVAEVEALLTKKGRK